MGTTYSTENTVATLKSGEALLEINFETYGLYTINEKRTIIGLYEDVNSDFDNLKKDPLSFIKTRYPTKEPFSRFLGATLYTTDSVKKI